MAEGKKNSSALKKRFGRASNKKKKAVGRDGEGVEKKGATFES